MLFQMGMLSTFELFPVYLKEALREERNKAIDECMREIERLNDDGVLYESTARKVLEFLKSDSK